MPCLVVELLMEVVGVTTTIIQQVEMELLEQRIRPCLILGEHRPRRQLWEQILPIIKDQGLVHPLQQIPLHHSWEAWAVWEAWEVSPMQVVEEELQPAQTIHGRPIQWEEATSKISMPLSKCWKIP